MAFDVLSESMSSVVLLCIIGLLLILYIWNRPPSGIPPLPVTPLPIVGNLLSLEKDPRHIFAKWRKECGDIFSLYMGSKLVIVLSGYDCIREALVKQADVFSDRPDLPFFTEVLRNRGIGSTSGHLWKSQRKFAITALRDFGFGRSSLEGKILEESENVVKYFESVKGRKEHFKSIYNISTSNILCSVVFGRRYEYDDPKFIDYCKAVNNILASLPSTGLANFIPILRYFPGALAGFKQSLKCIRYLEEKLVTPEIERHLTEYDGTANDFISAYIKEIKDRERAGEDTAEFKENLSQTVVDLFIGGTDTTAATLNWLVLFLIHWPEVQEKCFQEIKENVGMDRLPELKDKPVLPYVEATLAEAQRRSNIVPIGALHAASKPTTLRGFYFPKGVTVMVNLDSVVMDPKIYPNPEEFRPERFLDKDGNFYKPQEFIPFSAGRRLCLGESLAKMELFLMGSAMLQRFHFQNPEDEPFPSLKPVLGISATPMPYKVKAVPRK